MQGGADTRLQDDSESVSPSQTQKKRKRIDTHGSSQGQLTRTLRPKKAKVEKNKGSHDPHQSDFMNPADRHRTNTTEDLGNLSAGRESKDPPKKLTARAQAFAKGDEEVEEGRTGGFRMPRNAPADISPSSPEDRAPRIKVPRSVPSVVIYSAPKGQGSKSRTPQNAPADFSRSSPEDRGPGFKVPRSAPPVVVHSRNVPADISRSPPEDRGPSFKMPRSVPSVVIHSRNDISRSPPEDRGPRFKVPRSVPSVVTHPRNVPPDISRSSPEDRGPGFKAPRSVPSVVIHSRNASPNIPRSPPEDRGPRFKVPRSVPLVAIRSSPEGQDSKFKMPRNVPPDILRSMQKDHGPKFKMPRNVPSDILRSSSEDQGHKFKMPVGLTLEKHGMRDTSNITRGMLTGKGDMRKIPDDPDTVLSNSSSLKLSAETKATNFYDALPLGSLPDPPPFASSQEDQGGFGVSAETPTARCPMCRETVDADFLSRFGHGRRMNVRMQAKFCRAHKQISAKAEWVARGYPDINWEGLQSRIEKYYSQLGDVLKGKTPSHFRENLEANFKAGKNRTLVQSIMSSDFRALTPGYYGSRGARIMMEAIMSKFSERIRKLAPKDKLISSVGVPGYIQAVMVPELAVLLVQEDMGLDVKAGRKVLTDSIDIGDMLNEDDDDNPR